MPRIRRAKSRAQGSAKPMSRLDERLRRARILADDDDDDEPKRQRSQAQTERMLNDPRVHKKIVENLYEAYKTRVRLCLCLLVRVCARVRVFFYVFDRSWSIVILINWCQKRGETSISLIWLKTTGKDPARAFVLCIAIKKTCTERQFAFVHTYHVILSLVLNAMDDDDERTSAWNSSSSFFSLFEKRPPLFCSGKISSPNSARTRSEREHFWYNSLYLS